MEKIKNDVKIFFAVSKRISDSYIRVLPKTEGINTIAFFVGLC